MADRWARKLGGSRAWTRHSRHACRACSRLPPLLWAAGCTELSACVGAPCTHPGRERGTGCGWQSRGSSCTPPVNRQVVTAWWGFDRHTTSLSGAQMEPLARKPWLAGRQLCCCGGVLERTQAHSSCPLCSDGPPPTQASTTHTNLHEVVVCVVLGYKPPTDIHTWGRDAVTR